MGCNRCYEIVEQKVGGAFRRYGRFVARHPWKIIIVVVAVNLLLGLGILRLNEIADILITYTPTNSEASKSSDKLRQMFPDLSASNYIDYQMPEWGRMAEIIVKPNSGNILDVDFLREAKKLYDFVLSIKSADDDGNVIEVSQICAKNAGACAVDGSFFFDDAFLAQVTAKTVPFPYLFHPSRGPIYYEQLVGGANASSGFLHSATMLILKVYLRSDSDHYVKLAEYWQDTFIDNIETYQSDSFDFAYAHRDSISLELNKNINRDLGLFTITFTLMIIYACAATLTARIDCVGQRCILGIGGVMAAGLSLLSSFGISSACGVDYVSIVGVIPFLILGIGVDDMFILMSGMAETNFADDVETRIGDTMATSGISITITSLTDLIAFAAGASSVFPAVRNFCIYCSVAVVFCYINQASMFLACLAINEHRTADNRHFATCRPVPTREEAEAAGKSRRYVVCCTGRKSRDISETYSMLDHIPRWLIPKLVLPVYMKVIVLVVFVGYMGASVYGITQMEEGLNLKQLVADDSYYMKFGNLQEGNFPFVIPVSLIFDSPLKYSDSNVQGQIETLLQSVKNEPTVKDDFEINWLRNYKQYAGYDNSSETGFISGLKSFLNITSNKRFENDAVFDDTRNLITYSRIYVMSVSIKDSQEQGSFMLRMREIAAESSLPVFVHSGLFIFYEQYVTILPQTLLTVGVAIVAVLIVTCIFMPHPVMIAFITLTVIMITTGIFGFHYYIDRTLSSITMVLIIMSVGFSVDFSAHICHGYMISSGRDRNERTRNAILRSGAPIFHGAMSTLIGVSVLAAGRSFTSITFFKVMIIVLVFAIAHALLLLPVILSLFGPNPSENKPKPVAAKKKNHARRKHPEQDMRVSQISYKASPFVVNPQFYTHPPRYGYPFYRTYASQAPHEYDAPPRYGYPYYTTYAGQAPNGYDTPWSSFKHWYPAQNYPNWLHYQQYSYPQYLYR